MRLPECRQPANAARVQEIEYLLVINLEKRGEYAIMLWIIGLLCHLYLLKQLDHGLLGYSRHLTVMVRPVVVPLRIALHGERLSTSRLTVCKYCCVIAFDNLIDQSGDAKASIYILLLLVRREHLVEIVYFATIYLWLMNVLGVVWIWLHDFDLVGATYY